MNIKLIFILCAALAIATAAQSQNRSYQYDALNRLKQVTYSNGVTVTYTYDKVGNRKIMSVAGQVPMTYVPDDNFEQALIDLGYDQGVPNNYVPTANIANVISLNVNQKQISDLTGIEDFTALKSLRCFENQLSSLNVSQNTNLNYLACHNNSITGIDVGQNTKLTVLSVAGNALTNLDVSANTLLVDLNTYLNPNLVFINASQNPNLTTFKATSNHPSLCIKVANEVAASQGQGQYANWLKDQSASYSLECLPQYTSIPDPNFEAALVELGYDNIPNDGQVPTANITTVTFLNVNEKQISDLTGIEDFTALKSLRCANNQLSSLNVSQNTNLNYLACHNNSITGIDVSQNTKLTVLSVAGNALTTLDVSANTLLADLNTYLNPNLVFINASQNPNLTTFKATSNHPSLCIKVANEVAASQGQGQYTNWLKDQSASYSANCGNNGRIKNSAEDTEEKDVKAKEENTEITLSPNPTGSTFRISAPEGIQEVVIYDNLGKRVPVVRVGNEFDVRSYQLGIYMVAITTTSGERKIIKLVKR